MDLLSLVSQTTKRKGDIFAEAEALAKRWKTQQKLERKMLVESRILVKSLRDEKIRWDEYARSVMQKTLSSALAAVYIGAEGNKPEDKMERAWPIIVGSTLPPLVKFLAQTKARLDANVLKKGDKTLDFADAGDLPEDLPEDFPIEDLEAYLEDMELEEDGKGQTWPGLFNRVTRYLATPIYCNIALGLYLTRRGQGYKEMRRYPKRDKRVCPDCKKYAQMDWQPIGSLPVPGQGCKCYDRCRCVVEYR